jgi:hypothetical protein
MASFSLVLNLGSVVPSARLFFSLELMIPSAPFVPSSRVKIFPDLIAGHA